VHACSYYKRTLDTTSRYKYIVSAYENLKKWVAEGTEDERKIKRYIHRHLTLPPDGHYADVDVDGKELLTQFGYHYVTSLLNYCSDDIKEGMCLVLSLTHYLISYRSH